MFISLQVALSQWCPESMMKGHVIEFLITVLCDSLTMECAFFLSCLHVAGKIIFLQSRMVKYKKKK